MHGCALTNTRTTGGQLALHAERELKDVLNPRDARMGEWTYARKDAERGALATDGQAQADAVNVDNQRG